MRLFNAIPDDELTDIVFGDWIKSQRHLSGYKVEYVTSQTNITEDRMAEIETGAGKGINRWEAFMLSITYHISLSSIMAMATGAINEDETKALEQRIH